MKKVSFPSKRAEPLVARKTLFKVLLLFSLRPASFCLWRNEKSKILALPRPYAAASLLLLTFCLTRVLRTEGLLQSQKEVRSYFVGLL